MKNLNAGFWIRLSARLLDLIFILLISFISLYPNLQKNNNEWQFVNNVAFYIWLFTFMFMVFGYFIVLPFVWNGQTIFMRLLKIRIKFNNDENIFKSILIRESMFSLMWIFMAILYGLLINHTLAFKYSLRNQKDLFSDWERVRINLFATVGSIYMTVQFIFAISIVIRKNKIGLHDSTSNTETIWINKMIKEKKNKKIEIKPKQINNNEVIWV